MSCFELVKSVLDEAYADIRVEPAGKDALIRHKMEELRGSYGDLANAPSINYRDPAVRFAYVYTYVTCHANIVFKIVRDVNETRELLSQQRVNISCLGGGPGSDILGILKHLEILREKPILFFQLLDRESSWNECWCDVGSKLESEFTIHTSFVQLDVCDEQSWEPHTKYLRSDIFTMIFFISEIERYMINATAYFDYFLSRIKSGALVLFVDNRNAKYYRFFDSLCAKHGLQIVASVEEDFQLAPDEEKKDLGEYFHKFGNPRLKGKVAWRVAKKP